MTLGCGSLGVYAPLYAFYTFGRGVLPLPGRTTLFLLFFFFLLRHSLRFYNRGPAEGEEAFMTFYISHSQYYSREVGGLAFWTIFISCGKLVVAGHTKGRPELCWRSWFFSLVQAKERGD